MNWRHRVQEILTGKKLDTVHTYLDDEFEKIVNKCRYKYSGFKDIKKVSMNPFKTIKRYKVGNSIYKIETIMFRKACGFTDNEKKRRQAIKLYYKKHIYNNYDKIPEYFNNRIDWRRSKKDGSRWIVWEYLKNMGV